MYTSEIHTQVFDLTRDKDLQDYDKILNNPLNIILSEVNEKLSDREMEEGRVTSINDRLVKVVTWKEKKLL